MRLLFSSSKGYNFVSNSKAWYGQARQAENKTVNRTFRFCLKTHFFPPISPTVHLYSVKTITELHIFSETLSKVKIFENAGHSFTCGRTKTEVLEYDDVMHHILTPLHNINRQNVMANKFILGRLGENQPYKVLM